MNALDVYLGGFVMHLYAHIFIMSIRKYFLRPWTVKNYEESTVAYLNPISV